MLTIKASAAVVVFVATAAASAGAGYLVTRATMQSDVTASCPQPSVPAAGDRAVPLGGPPLPINQGKKW
jgi:hypothetical protein